MRVSIWPIRIAGSWVYLAGSWKEATSCFIVILIDIRENTRIMFKLCLLSDMNQINFIHFNQKDIV